MPTVKVGDINMYYEIHGEGEPLVLIMGYGGNSRWWFGQISTLSQEYRVVAQEFALRHPDRVVSLVLGCTTPGGPNAILPDAEAMALLFDMERAQRLTPEQNARELLPFLWRQEFIDNNPDIAEQLIAIFVQYLPPPHGFTRQAEEANKEILDFLGRHRRSR